MSRADFTQCIDADALTSQLAARAAATVPAPTLKRAALVRMCEQARTDAYDVPEAADELHAWAVAHAEEVAFALAAPVEAVTAWVGAQDPVLFPGALLAKAKDKRALAAVRERADRERSSEVAEAAAVVSAGAVRLDGGTWSLNGAALVELAHAVGRGGVVAFALEGAFRVTVPAGTLMAAGHVTKPARWTCELVDVPLPPPSKRVLTKEERKAKWEARPGWQLRIACGGARGYRLRGAPLAAGDRAGIVALPVAMPCEATAEDFVDEADVMLVDVAAE